MRIICILYLAAMTSIASIGREPYINPVPGQFPILAWYSIRPDAEQTTERYQELAEAGFNISFSHFATRQEIANALNACRGTGVKLMLTTQDLEKEEHTGTVVNQFKNDEMVAGWFLRDEPTPHSFQELKKFKERILSFDSKHMLYLNLLPNYVSLDYLGTSSYREYIRKFVDDIDLGFFSYDHYPVVIHNGDTIVRPLFYSNLEDALAVSQSTGEPFWAFALSTAHDPYPTATKEMLRLEVFSNLAYGAQGIQYFTYWNPGNTGTWNFNTAPISLDGHKTHVWYLVRELNKEIQQLAPVFLGAKVIDVSHTGKAIPQGTHPLKSLPLPITGIQSDGEGVVVSHLKNAGKEYLMIVNRDLHHPQTVTIQKKGKVQYWSTCQPPSTDRSQNIQCTLNPGDYFIVML